MNMNKKGLEIKLVIVVIFSLLLLLVLMLIAGQNFKWVNAITDVLFGG